MATIIAPTLHGFAVTGLTQAWEYDLAQLAQDIGVLGVSWADPTRRSLTVVCNERTDDEARTLVAIRLRSILTSQEVYTADQEAVFYTLGSGMVLVRFDSGLPEGNHIVCNSCHRAISDVVYGSSNMVLVRTNGVSDEAWLEGIQHAWSQLWLVGVSPRDTPEGRLITLPPWTIQRGTGQVVMVDPGLAIIETYEEVRPEFKPEQVAHDAVPVVVGQDKYFVLAAGHRWPKYERTALTAKGVHFLVEVGRTSNTLAAHGYLDIDAPLTVL